MAIKSVIQSTSQRPKTESKLSDTEQLVQVISGNFSLTTLLLIGALLQGTLLVLVPRFWVLLPTVLILSARALHTAAVTLKLIPNPQMADAILKRTTPVVPNVSGEFDRSTSTASSESIAVFILSMRMNHPLGYLAPGVGDINRFQTKMANALDANAATNGFMGQTQYTATSAQGSPTLLLISYWRSIADVHAFAAGPEHKAAWSFWEAHAADLKHVGISHEIFQAPRHMYEAVYMNFQPTRLGATSFFRQGDEMMGGSVPDQWVNPLVDASRGNLRTSKGRLGWKGDSHDEVERRLAMIPDTKGLAVAAAEKRDDSAYESM